MDLVQGAGKFASTRACKVYDCTLKSGENIDIDIIQKKEKVPQNFK